MGFVLGLMLLTATMGRLMLSWPGALVATYYAMQPGWKPVLSAMLGLLAGNLAVLPFIPAETSSLLALHRAPWLLLVRCAVVLYFLGLGLWLVYLSRQYAAFAWGGGFLSFLTGFIAQLGNIDAQFVVVFVASGFSGTQPDPSTSAIARAATGLLFAFAFAETVTLVSLPLLTKLLATHVRRSRIGAYLGIMIVAAGALLAIPSGPLHVVLAQDPGPAQKP